MSHTSKKQLSYDSLICTFQAGILYQLGHQNTVWGETRKRVFIHPVKMPIKKVHLRQGWWPKSRDFLNSSHQLVLDYIDYLYNYKYTIAHLHILAMQYH
jgi:hypothetical protein